MAAVIVELSRHEVELNIGPATARIGAAHESAGFGHIRDARAASAQPVTQVRMEPQIRTERLLLYCRPGVDFSARILVRQR
jgi:hypothetical protein